MEMPKPGPVHQQLAALAGTWKGEEKMHPSEWCPEGGTATATLTNRVTCGGFYVAGDYEQHMGGEVTFEGHAVWSFDGASQEVQLHWFDSMGMGVEVFRGKFEGQRLVLTSKNPMGIHRLTYDLTGGGAMQSRMEMSQDGKQWRSMFDGSYRRG